MINDQVTTGSIAIIDRPLGIQGKRKTKYKDFTVPSDIFRKFDTGRNKFERWSKYLNLEDENQQSIYSYAKKNRKSVIILRDETTGAMRCIRRKASNEKK
tara:strand:+ start:115 stop:414 length:300 start_codon:yes stop_codon:yes gene_type:complete